jgi:putative SOS response-associated peptidase YedK
MCGRAKLPDDVSEIKVLKPLHHRMPVLLAPNRWAAWLGETVTADAELKAMLKPFPETTWLFGRLTAAPAMSATTARTCPRHFRRRSERETAA